MLPTRKATLIINPAAGRPGWSSSIALRLSGWLRHHGGFRTEAQYTTAEPGSAERLARAAAADSGLILACGGDGTVHEVVQGLAHRDVALGVIPLGTANALARNLGVPLDPREAIQTLLGFAPRRIPLGRLETSSASRYFVLMAGCGPDGALAHSLNRAAKARFGRHAYYAHAARLLLSRRWPAFDVEYRVGVESSRCRAVAVMVSRVPDLGGAFSGLTRGASLTSDRLQVRLVRAPALVSLPAWFGLSRLRWPNPWLKTVEADELRCFPLEDRPVYAQVDAEPLGAIPLTMRIVPNALTLLMPPAP
jgi:diacylglycerol kinase family enzyme